MAVIPDYKLKREENVRDILTISNDVLGEIEVAEDSGKDFLFILIETVIDSLGFKSFAENYTEAVAELAIIAQVKNFEISKLFADCYRNIPPKDLYNIYLKQRPVSA